VADALGLESVLERLLALAGECAQQRPRRMDHTALIVGKQSQSFIDLLRCVVVTLEADERERPGIHPIGRIRFSRHSLKGAERFCVFPLIVIDGAESESGLGVGWIQRNRLPDGVDGLRPVLNSVRGTPKSAGALAWIATAITCPTGLR
jgi:hypothetical protein